MKFETFVLVLNYPNKIVGFVLFILMGVFNCSTTLPPSKQYGVTKPLSLAGPTEADIQRTKELEKVCPFKVPFYC